MNALALRASLAATLLSACGAPSSGTPASAPAQTSPAPAPARQAERSPAPATGPAARAPDPTLAPAPAPTVPHPAELLAPAKGNAAAAAYRAQVKTLCATATRAQTLSALGYTGDPDALCGAPVQDAQAIATGAFVQVGADEVLVDVATGMPTAGGDHALALLRHDGQAYQLARFVFVGQGPKAVARFTTGTGRDLLFACEHNGRQGLYPSTCGFLGNDGAMSDDLSFVSVILCGPHAEVALGEVGIKGDHLEVALTVTKVLNTPDAALDQGDVCSKRVIKDTQSFALTYRYENGVVTRVTPIPNAVSAVLGAEN